MEVVTPCGRRVYTYRRVLVLGASEDGVERAHRVLLLALRAASHAPGAKHSCVGRRSDQAGSGRDRARGGRAAGDAPGAGRGRARGENVGGDDGVHLRVFLRWVVRLVVERASKIDEPRGWQDRISGPPVAFATAWQRGAGQSRVHRTTPPTGRVSQTSRTCSRSRRSRSSSPSTSARVAPTDASPVRHPSSSRRRALKR